VVSNSKDNKLLKYRNGYKPKNIYTGGRCLLGYKRNYSIFSFFSSNLSSCLGSIFKFFDAASNPRIKFRNFLSPQIIINYATTKAICIGPMTKNCVYKLCIVWYLRVTKVLKKDVRCCLILTIKNSFNFQIRIYLLIDTFAVILSVWKSN